MATEAEMNDILSKAAQADDEAGASIARTAATATEQGNIQDSIKQQQAVKTPGSAGSFVTDPQFWSDVGQNWEDINVATVHAMMHGTARALDLVIPGDNGFTKDIDSSPSLQTSDPTSAASKVGEVLGNIAVAAPAAPETAGAALAVAAAKQAAFWSAVGFATGDDRVKGAEWGAAGGAGGEVAGTALRAAGTFMKTLFAKGGTEVAVKAAETAPHGMPTETTPWTPDSVAGADTATPKAAGTATPPDSLGTRATPTEPASAPASAPVASGEAAPAVTPEAAPTEQPSAQPTAPPVFDPKQFVGNLVAQESPEALSALQGAIVSGDLGKVGALQKYMPNLPWDQLADGGNLQATFAALADHYEGVVQSIGGAKVIPKEMQLQFAANQGRDPEVVMQALDNLGQHTDDGGLAARVLAGNHLDIETAAQLFDAATAVSNSTVGTAAHVAAVNTFNAALEMKVAVQAVMSGAKNELGRSLGALRYMAANRAIQIPDGFSDGKTATDIADAFLKKVRTPDGGINLQGANEGARAIKAIGPMDWLLEMSRNGLLSNPALHWINAKANVLRMGVSLLEQYAGAAVGTVSKGVGTVVHAAADAAGMPMQPMQEQLSLRTANAYTAGAWNAATDATVWKDAMAKALTDATVDFYGQPSRLAIKGNIQLADLPNALQGVTNIQNVVDMANKALDVTGQVVRTPGRLLGVADHLNVTIAQRASLTQQAYMRAASMADASSLAGPERASFISEQMKDLLLNPTDGMLTKAQADGSYASMQEPAQLRPSFFGYGGDMSKPGIGAGVTNALNQSKFIKMAVAPFTTRPGNAFRQAIFDYTPIGAMFDKTTQTALMGGGVNMNLAAARILMGTTVLWQAWNLADAGHLSGSSTPGDLSQLSDRPDYSLRVGDTSIPVKRMEPVGLWLGAMADAYQAVKSRNTTYDIDGNASAPITRALMAFAMASGHLFTEMPAMSGLKRMLDVMTTRGGTGLEQKGINFVGGVASEAVPFSGLGGYINQQTDGHRHVPENIWQAICQRIPGMESAIHVARDIFGRAKNSINQYAVTQGTQNPLSQAVSKVQGNIQLPKQWLVAPTDGQQGVPLPDNLSRELEQIKGEQALPGLGNKTFPDYAQQFIQGPNWQSAGQHGALVSPDGGNYEHMEMLKELLKKGNSAAWQQLYVNHPDLRQRQRDAAQAQLIPITPAQPQPVQTAPATPFAFGHQQ